MTRREQGKQLFTPAEWVLFGIALVGAIVGIHGLVTGYITI
jgi:arginine:ornithine antiporter/lysine permease